MGEIEQGRIDVRSASFTAPTASHGSGCVLQALTERRREVEKFSAPLSIPRCGGK
jgi:hypothetical protein